MINADTINAAYAAQANLSERVYETGRTQITAKTDLDRKRADGLLDGTITGKNAGARDASARELLQLEFYRLDMAEQDVRLAKHKLELANIEVARVRALLRLAEMLMPTPQNASVQNEISND